MEIESTSNSSIIFRTTDAVDFTISASREVEVYERLNTGVPSKYLISKKVKAISSGKDSIFVVTGNFYNQFILLLN